MLTACKREGKIEIQTQKSVDSTDHLRVNIVQSVFTSADSEIQKSCDLLNAKVHYLIDSIQKSLSLQQTVTITENGNCKQCRDQQITVSPP